MSAKSLVVFLGLLIGFLSVRVFASEKLPPEPQGRWEKIFCPVKTALLAVDFIDRDNGWIVGKGGVILRTKDGGKKWTAQKSGTRATLMGVHFVRSGKVGWAVGASGRRGVVLRTEDGGETWKTLPIRPFSVSAVFAPGEDTAYFTSYGGPPIPNARKGMHADGDVAWTRDKGRSWKNDHRGPWVACRPMFDVCFVGASHGWAVGGQALCVKPNSRLYKPKGFLVHTADGGRTWEVQGGDIPLPPCRLEVTPGGKAARLGLKTGDILVAWNGKPTKDYIDFKHLMYPKMPSPFGPVRRETVDMTVLRDGKRMTVKIELVTGESRGFGVEDGSIPLFLGVSFIDEKTGFIVGEQGLVYRTGDGGKSWTRQATPDRTTLWSVCALDTKTAFAVGEGGAVLYTTQDAGSWRRVKVPTKESLYAVDFLGEDCGWAVGANGTLLRWKGKAKGTPPKPLKLGSAQDLSEERIAEIQAQLQKRRQEDQAVRKDPKRRKDMKRVDQENTKWFRDLVQEVGWIDVTRFGSSASNAAFLIVQHSGDLPLMLAALPPIEKDVKAGLLDGQNFALLYDRLQLRLGNKQKYGTQIGQNKKGELVVLPLQDRKKVEQFRKEIGIMPLAAYLRIIERVYKKKPKFQDDEPNEKD